MRYGYGLICAVLHAGRRRRHRGLKPRRRRGRHGARVRGPRRGAKEVALCIARTPPDSGDGHDGAIVSDPATSTGARRRSTVRTRCPRACTRCTSASRATVTSSPRSSWATCCSRPAAAGAAGTVVGCKVVLFEHLWLMENADPQPESLDELVDYYAC